jgi:hypothetical protein
MDIHIFTYMRQQNEHSYKKIDQYTSGVLFLSFMPILILPFFHKHRPLKVSRHIQTDNRTFKQKTCKSVSSDLQLDPKFELEQQHQTQPGQNYLFIGCLLLRTGMKLGPSY